MKNIEGTLVSPKLGHFMSSAVEELKWHTQSFDEYSDEALIFALIEYGRHNRNTTKEGRLVYLYEKAYLYDNGKDCTGANITWTEGGDFIIKRVIDISVF